MTTCALCCWQVTTEHLPVYVTPGAVDPAVFDPDQVSPAPFCAGYGVGPVFGFIARLSLEKGPGLFLAAAAIVAARMPDARFFMIGRPVSPQYFNGLISIRDSLGLRDVVGDSRTAAAGD